MPTPMGPSAPDGRAYLRYMPQAADDSSETTSPRRYRSCIARASGGAAMPGELRIAPVGARIRSARLVAPPQNEHFVRQGGR